MSALLWSLPGLPIVSGGLLLLVRWRPAVVATVMAAATLVLAVSAAVTRPSARTVLFAGIESGAAIDGLSAVMVVTVAAVSLAVLVFAAGEMREARFFGLMLIFVGAMLLTVIATDLVLLLMAWEVMGAMSYALIGFWWQDPDRVRSASIAFVTTRAGDLGLYLAAGCAMLGGQGLALSGLAASSWRDLIAAGLVAAALGKSAQLPFSFWLSRAMAGPSPVSALLHSATMVAAGAYLLLRAQPLLAATGWAATLVAWAGALTALLLGGVAVAQRDLKQLLAASTCAQIGFMVLGAGVAAVAGGTAHLVAHAAVKSLLFLGAGAWLTALGTKDLAELRGAARRYRLVGITFGVGGLALAGLPPLSLWVTKDAVLTAVHSPPLYVVSLGGALLAAAYAAKAVVAVWRPGEVERRRVRLPELIPLPVLAAVAAAFGVVGLPGVFDGWSRLVGEPAAPPPGAGELALSGGLAAAVVLTMVVVRPRHAKIPGRDAWAGWLRLEQAAVTLVWRPLESAAKAAAWFDDRVIDGAVRAVPRLGMAAARVARRPFETGVDGVVAGIVAGAARLGTLARRPQTGQVHTYFAQAAVVFVLLALVIVLVR
ncbi:NADH-quinone oxidoreductase subunit 5 family protein [Nonomuraea turcica]|uniref:NADH-quinone oxidoreductase subunit 5 family protein n=1 Tax=Nonomuraea sp. G32 TaxID=3067274 RepID=UPI00273C9E06|nr:proton-conducting transporter membrane subunit [Nonomuraea sp. G32]MDP4509880.1 proton-conducting transporter membrane subunit [Nonomuraea sp. G32]